MQNESGNQLKNPFINIVYKYKHSSLCDGKLSGLLLSCSLGVFGGGKVFEELDLYSATVLYAVHLPPLLLIIVNHTCLHCYSQNKELIWVTYGLTFCTSNCKRNSQRTTLINKSSGMG